MVDRDLPVTTWTLEMTARPTWTPRDLPTGTRLDRSTVVDPEYARFLYAYVGGPWRWTDRLGWDRATWAAELAVPGTEFLIPYAEGTPLGYVQLQPRAAAAGTEVEIRYFGLAERAIGRGLGGPFLEHAVMAAWSSSERFDLPQVSRVWVHTCSLDGPAALANYRARGLVTCHVEETIESVPEVPLGSWVSSGGPDVRA